MPTHTFSSSDAGDQCCNRKRMWNTSEELWSTSQSGDCTHRVEPFRKVFSELEFLAHVTSPVHGCHDVYHTTAWIVLPPYVAPSLKLHTQPLSPQQKQFCLFHNYSTVIHTCNSKHKVIVQYTCYIYILYLFSQSRLPTYCSLLQYSTCMSMFQPQCIASSPPHTHPERPFTIHILYM